MSLRAVIYKTIPKSWRKSLGKNSWLKPLRDSFFRTKTGYRELQVSISKKYGNKEVDFQFVSSIQIATKAKERGVETKLLTNTMQLLETHKPRKKNDYIIADVGTNFGFLSLVWAQTMSQEGTVYSFEPHPNVFATFCKSVALNKLNTIINANNLAVGKTPGSIEISLASTTSNTKASEVSSQQLKGTATIKMTSLDIFFKDSKRLDLIKIDVDGIEIDILKGAKKMLDILKPILVVETNGDYEIYNFFADNGYTILNMEMQPFDIQHGLPVNIFCIPK